MFHTFSASPTDGVKPNQLASQQERQDAHVGAAGVTREKMRHAANETSNPQVQQTLTVCTRCRHRKIKCDPGLPRCNPCDKANSQCEYFDVSKRTVVSRKYVVWLQHKIRELESEMARLEVEDQELDSELAVRDPGLVRLKESEETKFLGPSSGIAIARVVMNLAKTFTDSSSIQDIISDSRIKEVEKQFADEETRKVPKQPPIPMHSEAPAVDLPSRELTINLVELFFTKVHVMYPILHEPSFREVVDKVYQGSRDVFENFALRMVISVGMQRMEKNFAALADAYYLAALKYLERLVQEKSLRTLQGYALIAAYSLSTPTRTAIYYVIGAAVRLVQALGFIDKRTIGLDQHGRQVDPLELDMRRRLAWSIIVMDFGLAHSLGRPAAMSVLQDSVQIDWFEVVEDEYITRGGILLAPGPSIRKWVARHFFKMRLLQLEIRKKLYQKKRAEPVDDGHPWFREMETKLAEWRDASPLEEAGGTGLDKAWFIGRYNTMLIFLYRPSPQVPKPSLAAARKCYEACQFNVYMHQMQIKRRNVEVTWIFTQSIFMVINTLLWTLSFEAIRKEHPREEVKDYLDVGLECINLSAERWPGSASAHGLYEKLIEAVLHIYDKDGDVSVVPNIGTSSPEVVRSTPQGVAKPETQPQGIPGQQSPIPPDVPFGYIQPNGIGVRPAVSSALSQLPITPPSGPVTHPPTSLAGALNTINTTKRPTIQSSTSQSSLNAGLPPTPGSPLSSQKGLSSRGASQSPIAFDNLHYYHPDSVEQSSPLHYNPQSAFNSLPSTFNELSSWAPNFAYPAVSPNFLPTNPFGVDLQLASSPISESPYGATSAADYMTAGNYGITSHHSAPPQPNLPPAPGPHLQQYLGQQHQQHVQVSPTSRNLPAATQAQQQGRQWEEAFPDPYWTSKMLTQGAGAAFGPAGGAAMMGNGLPVEQQAHLMQDLESIGPEQIEQMIAASNAMYNPPNR